MKVFISGHLTLTDKEFQEHYVPFIHNGIYILFGQGIAIFGGYEEPNALYVSQIQTAIRIYLELD